MNEVVDFLKEKNEIYSFRTLKKKFNLKKNVLARKLNNSEVVKALPKEVGCGKHTMNLWKSKSFVKV